MRGGWAIPPTGRWFAPFGPNRAGYAVRPTSFAAGYSFIRGGRGCRGRGFRERPYHRAFSAAGFAWRQPLVAPVGPRWGF